MLRRSRARLALALFLAGAAAARSQTSESPEPSGEIETTVAEYKRDYGYIRGPEPAFDGPEPGGIELRLM